MTAPIHHEPALAATYCPGLPLVDHDNYKDCLPVDTALCTGQLGGAVQTLTVIPAKPSVSSQNCSPLGGHVQGLSGDLQQTFRR